jgi:hypothetical protein
MPPAGRKYDTARIRKFRATELSKLDESAIRNVEEYRCSIVHVAPSRGGTGWSYSLGVFDTCGGPEILTVGLLPKTAQFAINAAVALVCSGVELTLGRRADLVGEVECVFRPVEPRWVAHLMPWAGWLSIHSTGFRVGHLPSCCESTGLVYSAKIKMSDERYLLKPPTAEPTQAPPHPKEQKRATLALQISSIAAFFALLAALGSIWQAFEVWRSREEARKAFDTQAKDVERSRKAAEETAGAMRSLSELMNQSAKTSEANYELGLQALSNSIIAFRTEIRPWLMVEQDLAKVSIDTLTAELRLRNHGKTPAYDVRIHSWGEFGHYKQGALRTFVEEGRSGNPEQASVLFRPILPEQSQTVTIMTGGRTISDKFIKQVVRLRGTVTYSDVFRNKYETSACYDLVPHDERRLLYPCPQTELNWPK